LISVDTLTWQKLGSCPSGERLVARLAFPEITKRLFCAIDSENNRHLLIILNVKDLDFSDTKSRGMQILTRELKIKDLDVNRYLDLECLDSSSYLIFDIIGGEIANDLAGDNVTPIEIIQKVLTKWRRFWGQIPQQYLSKNEQIGLLGELYFLSKWMIPKYGVDIIRSWRGPWGGRNDFELPKVSIEIKTTTNIRGRIFEIHGITQMENPNNGSLLLFCLRLREESNAITSIPLLIAEIHSLLQENDELLNLFENGLSKVGFSELFVDEYSKLKFRIIEEVLFRVGEDFPKLINANFINGIPAGIEKIDYEINLNNSDHLIISKDSNNFELN
jgi:hypothetical protein